MTTKSTQDESRQDRRGDPAAPAHPGGGHAPDADYSLRVAKPGTSQARPGDPLVPGQERRACPDDPEPGVGRHTRGNDGEGEVKQGEESQAGRRRGERERPDDPEPGDGRHLRGDGEGVRSRGEERQEVGRRGVRGLARRQGKQKDYCPTWLFDNWDGNLFLERYEDQDQSDAVWDFNQFCWQGAGGIRDCPSLPSNLQPVSSVNKNVFLGDEQSSVVNLLSACFPPHIISNLHRIEETPRYIFMF